MVCRNICQRIYSKIVVGQSHYLASSFYIYQYIEGQTPPPVATPKPQQAKPVEAKGRVLFVTIFTSNTCTTIVQLPSEEPNNLGLPPGTIISLSAPSESSCTLFGLSKIGK